MVTDILNNMLTDLKVVFSNLNEDINYGNCLPQGYQNMVQNAIFHSGPGKSETRNSISTARLVICTN